MNKELKEIEKEIKTNKTYSDELKKLKNDRLKLKALNALMLLFLKILMTYSIKAILY